jgi:hypothetical protein
MTSITIINSNVTTAPNVVTKPKTDTFVCCWDLHKVKGLKPIPAVWKWNAQTKKFETFGKFCSANCAKAFILSLSEWNSFQLLAGQWHMLKHEFPEIADKPIATAPSRYMTKLFDPENGITIQDYRKRFCTNRVVCK